MPKNKDVHIGNIEIKDIEGSVTVRGNITSQINTGGGDIIAGDKIIHIHYHNVGSNETPMEKDVQSFEPWLVIIKAGEMTMGSDDYGAFESPVHSVELPAYGISRYPVTNEEYLAYVKATGAPVPDADWQLAKIGREPHPEKLRHPVVGIAWDEAVAYCVWLQTATGRSYRLPTEAEWEMAARGVRDQRPYPWGTTFDTSCCNFNGDQTTTVDHFSPQGDSPTGCADLAGNVAEWTNTQWGLDYTTPDYAYPYEPDSREEPTAHKPHREYRIIRGGSFLDEQEALRCSARDRQVANERSPFTGFRVVQQLPKPSA
ncbi:MAG: formylglycine-generating enzyme family protein [Chloroflexota bacterium]